MKWRMEIDRLWRSPADRLQFEIDTGLEPAGANTECYHKWFVGWAYRRHAEKNAITSPAPRPSDDVAKLRDALAALKNVQRHMNVLLKENVEAMTATVCDHVVAAHSICGEAIAASILTPADDVAKLREAVRNLRQEQQQRCGDPEYHEGYDHALGDVLDALAALADGEKSNG